MRFHLAGAFLLTAVAAAKDVLPPDVTKGRIDGKIALYVLPLEGVETVPEGGAKFERMLPPDGCEVHLSSRTDPDQELVYDCSKWILPPKGNYRLWLEAPNAISEGYAIFEWDHEPFEGRGTAIAFGLEPAGRVALAEGVALPAGTSFRLVHLRSTFKGMLRRVFDRRVQPSRVRTGASLPAGPVIAGIFDAKSGDVLALTRPISIQAGKTTFAAPVPPENGSDVFVILTRPRLAELGKDDVVVTLSANGKSRAPDVLLGGSDRVFAVWYAFDARKATLQTSSKTLRLDPVELTLTRGKVTTHRAKLVDR